MLIFLNGPGKTEKIPEKPFSFNDDLGDKLERIMIRAANKANAEFSDPITTEGYYITITLYILSIITGIIAHSPLYMVLLPMVMLFVFDKFIQPNAVRIGEGKPWEKFLGAIWLPMVLVIQPLMTFWLISSAVIKIYSWMD